VVCVLEDVQKVLYMLEVAKGVRLVIFVLEVV
jgi:hypothetical protein